MREFFRNPSKVALTSLMATIAIAILLMCVLRLSGADSRLVHMFGKGTITISLPILILNPIFGFIYSFKINGKMKILYILLHFACISTISVIAFIAFMFRYFVPFGP